MHENCRPPARIPTSLQMVLFCFLGIAIRKITMMQKTITWHYAQMATPILAVGKF